MTHRPNDESNRYLLLHHVQQISTRLTTIQGELETFTAHVLEQLQQHALEIEQLHSDVEQLKTRLKYLAETKPAPHTLSSGRK